MLVHSVTSAKAKPRAFLQPPSSLRLLAGVAVSAKLPPTRQLSSLRRCNVASSFQPLQPTYRLGNNIFTNVLNRVSFLDVLRSLDRYSTLTYSDRNDPENAEGEAKAAKD